MSADSIWKVFSCIIYLLLRFHKSSPLSLTRSFFKMTRSRECDTVLLVNTYHKNIHHTSRRENLNTQRELGHELTLSHCLTLFSTKVVCQCFKQLSVEKKNSMSTLKYVTLTVKCLFAKITRVHRDCYSSWRCACWHGCRVKRFENQQHVLGSHNPAVCQSQASCCLAKC